MIPGRSHSLAGGDLTPLLALAGLLAVLSWAIVAMPVPVPLVLVAGGAAVAAWTLRRNSVVYTLALVIPFGLSYEVLGLNGVGPVDAVLLMALVVAAVGLVEGRGEAHRFTARLGMAVLVLWLLLLLWSTLTFILGPANEGLFKDPVRDTWYLYRGVWRNFLVLPVVVLCLTDRHAGRRALAVAVMASSVMSVYAIALSWQTHEPPTGLFSSKNGLAGFLVLILPFAMARLILEKRPYVRLLYGAAALIMLRALWLTASRGGFVAFLVSLLPFAMLVPFRRLAVAGAAAMGVLLVVFGLKGNILNRPNFRRYMTLLRFSEEHNFRWREVQWRLFKERIAERPWLGSGSEVIEALNRQGRLPTAHNGYLGMALKAGIPATAAWIAVLLLLGAVSLRYGRKAREVEEKAFWIGTAGMVLAWMTHNLVDNVLLMSEAQRVFWMIAGMAVVEAGSRRGGPLAGGANRSEGPR